MSETTEPTLSDLLCAGLKVVFVGINPSRFSVAQGHYFARKTNRFWPCFSRSTLSQDVRRALGVEQLAAFHDHLLPAFGIGFTDVVKRPTVQAAELTRDEFAAGARLLITKLEHYKPRVACFHGLTGFRHFAAALGLIEHGPALGAQQSTLGRTRLFVVPNPSGANAHFTPTQQTEWYDRLAEQLQMAT